MKIAILILAHKNREQLDYLISFFQHPSFRVYLHLDRNAVFTYDELESDFTPLVPNYACSWGGYGVTKATFDLLKIALNDHNDYYLLISGQDFPIKPLGDILSFFKQNDGKSYMHIIPFPGDYFGATDDQGRKRLSQIHYSYNDSKNVLTRLKFSIIARIRKFQKLYKILIFPVPAKLYGGENWFNLHKSKAESLLVEYQKSKLLRLRMSISLLAEEILPHTLIMRTCYDGTFVNNSLRYTVWKHPANHPEILKIRDFKKIKNSEALFARKFNDIDVIEQFNIRI